MRTRFLPIFFGVAFVLTLYSAVAAGAQDERSDTEGVKVQAVEVQQQQVPNDQQQQQQQVVAVQQQQVQNDQQQVVAVQQQVGVQAQRCPGAKTERTIKNPTKRRVTNPDITGGAVLITYNITSGTGELDIELRDEDGRLIVSETVEGDTGGPQKIRQSTDPGTHEFLVRADNGLVYSVKLEDCTNFESRNGDGGGGGGDGDGGGGGRDGGGGNRTNPTNPVTPAQDTTTPTTTTDTTTTDTADSILENTTADDALSAGESVRDAGSFRCDFFLRTVRDENGALRAQYRDGNGNDELIVQRFEQCLSEDVLADTIPDRNLPFTGGMPLLFLAAIGLAATVAGVSVLRAVTRRGR